MKTPGMGWYMMIETKRTSSHQWLIMSCLVWPSWGSDTSRCSSTCARKGTIMNLLKTSSRRNSNKWSWSISQQPRKQTHAPIQSSKDLVTTEWDRQIPTRLCSAMETCFSSRRSSSISAKTCMSRSCVTSSTASFPNTSRSEKQSRHPSRKINGACRQRINGRITPWSNQRRSTRVWDLSFKLPRRTSQHSSKKSLISLLRFMWRKGSSSRANWSLVSRRAWSSKQCSTAVRYVDRTISTQKVPLAKIRLPRCWSRTWNS